MAQNPPAPQVPFALAPALADDDILDMRTKENRTLYKTATAALPHEFDCKEHNLRSFLEEVDARSDEYGWGAMLSVPEAPTDPDDEGRYMPDYHGMVNLMQARAHAETYVDTETRMAQDNNMLYNCLLNSLSKEAKDAVTLKKRDYLVNGYNSGVALLKVICMCAHVDTNATVLALKSKLQNLPEYMKSVNSDIEQFNNHVSEVNIALRARNAESTDLMTYLFQGYAAASDEEFIDYIKDRKHEYEDGAAITPETLMSRALNRYKIQIDQNRWCKPSEADEKIIALQSEIEKIKKKNNRGHQRNGGGGRGRGNGKHGGRGNRNQRGRDRNVRPDWMLKPPTDGESKTKHVNNKQYWWCPKHEAWGRHKPDACEGRGLKQEEKGKQEGQDKGDKKKLRLSKALANLAEASEEDSE